MSAAVVIVIVIQSGLVLIMGVLLYGQAASILKGRWVSAELAQRLTALEQRVDRLPDEIVYQLLVHQARAELREGPAGLPAAKLGAEERRAA